MTMKLMAYLPMAVIAVVGGLHIAGVVSGTVYSGAVLMMVGYATGLLHAAFVESERSRKRAKREIEKFVAYGHRTLEADDAPGDLDDDERLGLERSMTEAIAFLNMLDKTAPPWVRWRDRRRRRQLS
jgi:hypothetical protein